MAEVNKLDKLVEEIGKLTVLEIADLVKALEEKLGVSAQAMIAPAAAAPTEATKGGGDVGEEKTSFTVVLAAGGANKIGAIKAVREINQALGLKEAKDLVEAAPKEVLTNVNKETAEEAKKKLEAAGATVELK